MSKRLFFSLEDVDFNDDASIEAFARKVWQRATTKFIDEAPEASLDGDTEMDQGDNHGE